MKANHFWKKINCHDKIPWHFPDIGQMDKIPWHFFKIPWQFPDLEKILFFPDFSLTRGNPVYHMSLPRVNNLENLCNSLSSGDTVSPSTTIFVDEVS